MKRKHNVVATEVEMEGGTRWAAEEDPYNDQVAYGKTEDEAIANWWALYAIDERYPRKEWADYQAVDL